MGRQKLTMSDRFKLARVCHKPLGTRGLKGGEQYDLGACDLDPSHEEQCSNVLLRLWLSSDFDCERCGGKGFFPTEDGGAICSCSPSTKEADTHSSPLVFEFDGLSAKATKHSETCQQLVATAETLLAMAKASRKCQLESLNRMREIARELSGHDPS